MNPGVGAALLWLARGAGVKGELALRGSAPPLLQEKTRIDPHAIRRVRATLPAAERR